MAQPFIDCAIKLKDKITNFNEIEKVVAQVGEGTVHRLWEPIKEKQSPSSPYGAKFSVPYCIAVGLIDGVAGLKQFTEKRLKDPEIKKLSQKINYEINPNDEYPKNYSGDISIFMKNGDVLSAKQDCLRGGRKAPLSFEEAVDKFHANLDFANIKRNEIKKLKFLIDNIFSCKDLSELENIDFS